MRTAGATAPGSLSVDMALEAVNDAVFYCSRAFHVPQRTDYTDVGGTELVLSTPVVPIAVVVDGCHFAPMAPYDERFTSGFVRAFAHMGGSLQFSVSLSAAKVSVYGFLVPVPYTTADLEKTLAEVVTDSQTQLQWLPPAPASVARYRVLKAMAEELGAVDRAVYFSRMAKDSEADARVSNIQQGASSVVNANDIL